LAHCPVIMRAAWPGHYLIVVGGVGLAPVRRLTAAQCRTVRVLGVHRCRVRLLAGVAGPAAFVTAWVTGGLLKDGYSPVRDTISRLAEQGASTRPLMTAGFVGFGVLMPLYGLELARVLRSPVTGAAVAISGLATVAVAAFPVTAAGGTFGDRAHYLAAGTAYVANVVAPLAAARHLGAGGRRASRVAAVGVAAALVCSLRVEELTGLLQRTGLTLFDVWAIALALRLDRCADPNRARRTVGG
jgi:hypothetical membrane protein